MSGAAVADAGGPDVAAPRVQVWGSHAPPGWRVMVTLRVAGGELAGEAMTPERARAVAAELLDYADICEGKW